MIMLYTVIGIGIDGRLEVAATLAGEVVIEDTGIESASGDSRCATVVYAPDARSAERIAMDEYEASL